MTQRLLGFTTLFDCYWHVLYKSARRCLHHKEASEEVIHDFEEYLRPLCAITVDNNVQKQKAILV